MPLQFPIAPDARTALETDGGARTAAEARELAGGPVTLVSEWLRPDQSESEVLRGRAEAAIARGFVQIYEDARGRPVIAVTFWKPQSGAESRPDASPGDAPPDDHTDDLYFTKRSAKAKKRRRAPDPNQLDLFAGPDQQGAETRDPDNPLVVIVDEEGDGESFGGVGG